MVPGVLHQRSAVFALFAAQATRRFGQLVLVHVLDVCLDLVLVAKVDAAQVALERLEPGVHFGVCQKVQRLAKRFAARVATVQTHIVAVVRVVAIVVVRLSRLAGRRRFFALDVRLVVLAQQVVAMKAHAALVTVETAQLGFSRLAAMCFVLLFSVLVFVFVDVVVRVGLFAVMFTIVDLELGLGQKDVAAQFALDSGVSVNLWRKVKVIFLC
jgi:hypothetical protein